MKTGYSICSVFMNGIVLLTGCDTNKFNFSTNLRVLFQASGNNQFSQREFSIWVTDLPDECSDELLQRTFSTRFKI